MCSSAIGRIDERSPTATIRSPSMAIAVAHGCSGSPVHIRSAKQSGSGGIRALRPHAKRQANPQNDREHQAVPQHFPILRVAPRVSDSGRFWLPPKSGQTSFPARRDIRILVKLTISTAASTSPQAWASMVFRKRMATYTPMAYNFVMAREAPQTVVETPGYLRRAEKLLDEADREEIVFLVASQPKVGDLIVGTGWGQKGQIRYQKGVGKAAALGSFTFFTTARCRFISSPFLGRTRKRISHTLNAINSVP